MLVSGTAHFRMGLELTLNTEKAKKTADSINSSGGQAVAIPGDILDDNYINELVKKSAEFGNGKIRKWFTYHIIMLSKT